MRSGGLIEEFELPRRPALLWRFSRDAVPTQQPGLPGKVVDLAFGDLDNIRGDPRFQDLVRRMEARS